MLKLIRFVLGKLILFIDYLVPVKKTSRTAPEQKRVNDALTGLTLYEFRACPFCVKVRRYLKKENLSIELRDAARNPGSRDELVKGGGKYQVPCLRIPDGGAEGKFRFLYESGDIIRYLEDRVCGL